MTKKELTQAVAAKTGLTDKEAKAAIEAMMDTIVDEVGARRTVTLRGFGTFGTRCRMATTGRHPATGECLRIPARVVPTFKPGKKLKEECLWRHRR